MTSPYGTRRSMTEPAVPIQITSSSRATNSSNSHSTSASNSNVGSSYLSTSNSKLSSSKTSRKSGATITSLRRLSIGSNSTLPGISLSSSVGISTKKAKKEAERLALALEPDDEDDGEVKLTGLNSKELKHLFRCEVCNKVYRHSTCLVKHRWEHTAHWKEASKLLLSKHEQTKLLEASAILTALTAGSSLPDEKSYWPAAVSPPSSGLLGSQSLNIAVLTSPRSYPSQSLLGREYDPTLSHFTLDEEDEREMLHDSMGDSPDLEGEGEAESEESASTADDLAEGMFEMEIENELSNGGTTSRSGSSVLGEDLDEKGGYSSGGGGMDRPPVLLNREYEVDGVKKTPALGFFPISRELPQQQISFILAETKQSWFAKLKESQLDASKASHLELEATSESYSQAFKLYLKAAQSTLYLIKTTEDAVKKAELRIIAGRLVERAEKVKAVMKGVAKPFVKQRTSIEEQHLVLERGALVNGYRFEVWEKSDVTPSIAKSSIIQPALSQDQRKSGVIWTSALEILPQAKLVSESPNGRDIEQDNVSDCSLVAAFIVAEEHRAKFGSKLALSCLYPQDSNGLPKVSSTGVYNARILINGSFRCISIDDSLPTNTTGTELYCTSTQKKDQLWHSLVEKAYLKLKGGYGFTGSTSSVDLYALSGWIPEHVSLRSSFYRADKSWIRIQSAYKSGSCVLTLATGKLLSPALESKYFCLIPSHNYAILDMLEIDGQRSIEIMNPWKVVNSESRSMFVGWDTLALHFDSLHLNWDPSLYRNKSMLHAATESRLLVSGSASGAEGQSLQLRLRLEKDVMSSQELWILLVRHQKQTSNDDEYIGIDLADAGQHFFGLNASFSPTSLTNDSCLLYRFNATPEVLLYDIVVAYCGPNTTLDFTIEYYGSIAGSFEDGPPPFPFHKTIRGKWSDRTAGGNHTSRKYMNNPQYSLIVTALPAAPNSLADLKVICKTNASTTVNARIFRGGSRITSFVENDIISGNADYSYGTSVCETSKLRPGTYTIVVSSFSNLSESDFSLEIDSTLPLVLNAIPQEGAGMYSRTLSGYWSEGCNGGDQDIHRNPTFLLMLEQSTNVKIRVQNTSTSPVPIGLHIFSLQDDGTTGSRIATTDMYSDAACGILLEALLPKGNGNGYLVIPSTFTPGLDRDFQIFVYADKPVTFTEKQ